ncbi:hypothetical protein EXS74_03965, partial [Candidatus Woesearchaeota archaeon]|nr:hypothetical protein [Candidatus Woesearchaeota archaeon]
MNQRFAILFMGSDRCLSEVQRDYIVRRAGSLYFQAEKEGNVSLDAESDSLEGRITAGQWVSLGALGGVSYKAEVDTDKGKVKIGFLIREIP